MFTLLRKYIPVRYKQTIANTLQKLQYIVLKILLTPIETISGRYITFHMRPKYARDVRIVSHETTKDYSECAIAIQGPVVLANRFTMETLLLYKKYFPGALLILSVWEDEDPTTLAEARTAGIDVVLSKNLPHGGPININRQITTSRAGVEHARERGGTYILKTRSDQRMYSPALLSYLLHLLTCFPPYDAHARGRIIGMSANNARKKLYQFPDHVSFGYAEDMSAYWSAPLIEDPNIVLPFFQAERPFTAEAYLCSEYAKKLGLTVGNSEGDYLSLLGRYFAIADVSALDWYWYKRGSAYRRFSEHREFVYTQRRDEKLDFAQWLELYTKERRKSS